MNIGSMGSSDTTRTLPLPARESLTARLPVPALSSRSVRFENDCSEELSLETASLRSVSTQGGIYNDLDSKSDSVAHSPKRSIKKYALSHTSGSDPNDFFYADGAGSIRPFSTKYSGKRNHRHQAPQFNSFANERTQRTNSMLLSRKKITLRQRQLRRNMQDSLELPTLRKATQLYHKTNRKKTLRIRGGCKMAGYGALPSSFDLVKDANTAVLSGQRHLSRNVLEQCTTLAMRGVQQRPRSSSRDIKQPSMFRLDTNSSDSDTRTPKKQYCAQISASYARLPKGRVAAVKQRLERLIERRRRRKHIRRIPPWTRECDCGEEMQLRPIDPPRLSQSSSQGRTASQTEPHHSGQVSEAISQSSPHETLSVGNTKFTSAPLFPLMSRPTQLPKNIELGKECGSSGTICAKDRNAPPPVRAYTSGQGGTASNLLGKHRTVRTCISVMNNKMQGGGVGSTSKEVLPKFVQTNPALIIKPKYRNHPPSSLIGKKALQARIREKCCGGSDQSTTPQKCDEVGSDDTSTAVTRESQYNLNSHRVQGSRELSRNLQNVTHGSRARLSRPSFVPQLDLSKLHQQNIEHSPYASSKEENLKREYIGDLNFSANSSRISTPSPRKKNQRKRPVIPLTGRVVRCNQALFTARVCTALNLCLQREAQQHESRGRHLGSPSSHEYAENHEEKETTIKDESTATKANSPPNTSRDREEVKTVLFNVTDPQVDKITEAAVLTCKDVPAEKGDGINNDIKTADLKSTTSSTRLCARRVRLQQINPTKQKATRKSQHSESVPMVQVSGSSQKCQRIPSTNAKPGTPMLMRSSTSGKTFFQEAGAQLSKSTGQTTSLSLQQPKRRVMKIPEDWAKVYADCPYFPRGSEALSAFLPSAPAAPKVQLMNRPRSPQRESQHETTKLRYSNEGSSAERTSLPTDCQEAIKYSPGPSSESNSRNTAQMSSSSTPKALEKGSEKYQEKGLIRENLSVALATSDNSPQLASLRAPLACE